MQILLEYLKGTKDGFSLTFQRRNGTSRVAYADKATGKGTKIPFQGGDMARRSSDYVVLTNSALRRLVVGPGRVYGAFRMVKGAYISKAALEVLPRNGRLPLLNIYEDN